MRISGIIREKRRELGLTQEQVADRLGVTASAVNKWEREASLPDITVLPPLARLLGVDLNTLLDFSESLTGSEISAFINSLDGKVKSDGYASAFGLAEAKCAEYPNCESLLISAALYLDGALFLYDVENPEPYRAKINSWYERLCSSRDLQIREQAALMVINRCRASGDLGRAEELLNSLPQTVVDRREQLALLYGAQGRLDEARGIWQSRVLEGVNEAVTALAHLAEDAVKSGRDGDARFIAETIEDITAAARLPEWMGLSASLELAEAAGDAESYAEKLRRMKLSLDSPWEPEPRLYGACEKSGVNCLTARLLELIERDEAKKDVQTQNPPG